MSTKTLTYSCEHQNQNGSANLVHNGRNSFACAYCNQTLFVDVKNKELGAHGHTRNTVKHKLVSLKES